MSQKVSTVDTDKSLFVFSDNSHFFMNRIWQLWNIRSWKYWFNVTNVSFAWPWKLDIKYYMLYNFNCIHCWIQLASWRQVLAKLWSWHEVKLTFKEKCFHSSTSDYFLLPTVALNDKFWKNYTCPSLIATVLQARQTYVYFSLIKLHI